MSSHPIPPQGVISVDILEHHPDNPPDRLNDIDDLVRSIKAVGVLQPLIIQPSTVPGWYVVPGGNRRLAAAREAGKAEVPYILRPMGDRLTATRIRLIENGHRKGLTPMQQAREFGFMLAEGLSQAQIAEQTGFSAGHVSDRCALLDLDPQSQYRVETGKVSVADAVAAVRKFRNTSGGRKSRGSTGTSKKVKLSGPATLHFGPDHALSALVALRCQAEHENHPGAGVGGIGCGACWEYVIRADERGEAMVGDQGRVREQLILRALAGLPVHLNEAERAEFARRRLAIPGVNTTRPALASVR